MRHSCLQAGHIEAPLGQQPYDVAEHDAGAADGRKGGKSRPRHRGGGHHAVPPQMQGFGTLCQSAQGKLLLCLHKEACIGNGLLYLLDSGKGKSKKYKLCILAGNWYLP